MKYITQKFPFQPICFILKFLNCWTAEVNRVIFWLDWRGVKEGGRGGKMGWGGAGGEGGGELWGGGGRGRKRRV